MYILMVVEIACAVIVDQFSHLISFLEVAGCTFSVESWRTKGRLSLHVCNATSLNEFIPAWSSTWEIFATLTFQDKFSAFSRDSSKGLEN